MARADRSEVPFGDDRPGAFGHGRPATEKARHRSVKRAYAQGRAGEPLSMEQSDPVAYDELREHYEQGRGDRLEREPDSPPVAAGGGDSPAPAPPPVAPISSSSSKPSSSRVADGAGVLLGVLAYALVMNYLQGGTSQARGWIAAKFLNRPWSGTRTAPATPAKPSAPTTAVPATPANPTRLVTVRGAG